MSFFGKAKNLETTYESDTGNLKMDHSPDASAPENDKASAKKKQKVMTLETAERLEQETMERSPFLNAKMRHMDVYLGQSASVAQWRLATFIFLLLLALSVGGNIYLSGNVKVQPFVVQVDEHGYSIPVQMAEVSGVSERVIAAQIGQFITNSRIRVTDRNAQILFARNAYKSVSGGSVALNILNGYFSSNPPTQSKYPVKVDIKAIIPLTPETYQAEWSETTTDARGNSLEMLFQGIYEIAVSPPKDMQNLVLNPLGVYVTDYHVQQKIK
jgi:type IV secretion system protein VirB5